MLKLKMLKMEIPSEINIIHPTICEIFNYVAMTYGTLSDDMEFEVKVILNELILNAIRHGNKEVGDKRVRIKIAITKNNKLLAIIEDEGQGYNHRSLSESAACPANDMDLCEMKVSGRGLIIVRSLCEKIRFNNKGNRIIILKKLL